MEKKKHAFFAAANSYRGFISYFDKVFPSADYDRIFVLKGGPGTGKSSLMKALSKTLYEKDFEIQEIFCSSDPHSLDGVIAEKEGVKIAMLDGTAPHERDAVIPGAIDEIVNLGNNWDSRWLIGKKDDILRLSAEKKSAYKAAYNYLQIAGKSVEQIDSVCKLYFDKIKAKSKAESILGEYLSKEVGKIDTKLLSSFGRYGKYDLDPKCFMEGKVLSVSGDESSTYLFLDICLSILQNHGVNITVFPSALDPGKTDAILLNSSKVFVCRSADGDISADELLSIPKVEKERIRVAEEIRRDALLESARWFKIASDLHMRLEEIYSAAMDFTQNDLVLSEVLLKIEKITEKAQ